LLGGGISEGEQAAALAEERVGALGDVPELLPPSRRFGVERCCIGVVSGGFDSDKISAFEKLGSPVDAYGVGSAFYQGSYDFTADVVMLEGRPCGKVGRRYRPNPRLELVS